MTEKNAVCLRAMSMVDLESAVKILCDDLVKKTYMVPDLDRKGAEKLFLRLMELCEDEEHYVRGIYHGNVLIGWINDIQMEQTWVELGWVIDSEFHNRGYGTAAVKTALQELQGKGFSAVRAGAFTDNLASIRVMEKAGMKLLTQWEEIEYRGTKHVCVYYESRM